MHASRLLEIEIDASVKQKHIIEMLAIIKSFQKLFQIELKVTMVKDLNFCLLNTLKTLPVQKKYLSIE